MLSETESESRWNSPLGAPQESRRLRIDPEHARNTPTVFVIDDDPDARESFAALAVSLRLAAETFTSAEEFLLAARDQRPGCILVDLRLPGMTGLALQQQLVEAGCRLPVILISAHFSVRDAAQALQHGVFRIVEKPYLEDDLSHAIQEAIARDQAACARSSRERHTWRRYQSLTERERAALELILAGYPNKALERRLGLSRRTVERVRSAILAKMESLSFVELSAALAEAGVPLAHEAPESLP